MNNRLSILLHEFTYICRPLFNDWCMLIEVVCLLYFACVLLEDASVIENEEQFEEEPHNFCEEDEWTAALAFLFNPKSSWQLSLHFMICIILMGLPT
jgi:hypothetical protein